MPFNIGNYHWALTAMHWPTRSVYYLDSLKSEGLETADRNHQLVFDVNIQMAYGSSRR